MIKTAERSARRRLAKSPKPLLPVAALCTALGVLLLANATPSIAQSQNETNAPFSVLPSMTDSAIQTFNQPHLCWLPGTTPRNQLVLFLPGTHGQPRSPFPYLQTAASLGYHVIFLMYPDAIPAQSCMRDPNPNAYIQFRTAVIQGGDYGRKLHVTRADSIENRVQKLLVYLSQQQPKQG